MKKLFVYGLILMFTALGCAPTQPLPQPRRVVDPSWAPNAVKGQMWDIAAVGYDYYGQGLNYSKAGLSPVLLVFKNKGQPGVYIDPAEARGMAYDGEYLPYSLEEAQRLVFASETFRVTASNSARSGTLGAVIGAGLGLLIGSIGGGDNLWKGALIGGGLGAAAGVGGSVAGGSEQELRYVIQEEIYQYAWTPEPLPGDYTKVGYLYFPGNVGITHVKIVVRNNSESVTYTLPVDVPPQPPQQ